MKGASPAISPYILLLILLGFLAMFAASFYHFMHAPADSTARPAVVTTTVDSGPEQPELSEQQMDELAVLMGKLQSSPHDVDILMEIGGIFLAAKDWERAEAFLNRAVMSRPADTGPRYLLGIVLHQQGKIQEAAAAFEALLVLEEDPAAQYNLAVIYKYHLDKADEAQALFEQIVASPDADADTVERARKELQEE